MFTDYEKNIIIMALMYLKNDYSDYDFYELNPLNSTSKGQTRGDVEVIFEDTIQDLIETFVGPTWDEEATNEAIQKQTEAHSRNP